VSGGSRTRLSDAAGRCLGCSATDTVSKDGRSRTLWACFGGRLLTQEHALIGMWNVECGMRNAEYMPIAHSPFLIPHSAFPRSCPGRARTCNLPVNSGSHHRCATGQESLRPFGPGVINDQEPAVGLEPTLSALRERCPARRASPAWVSSQCWCRANSTEVQSLNPLPRAWPEVGRAGVEPANRVS
jgi:hypothetical protein